ncbi:MAG: tyrosine-type recombinase/integrase [Thermoguttaceae bacterium]
MSLHGIIEEFIKRSEGRVKARTLVSYRQEAEKLYSWFGQDRNPETITAMDAENFAAHLRGQGFAESTIHKIFRQTKLFFNDMVEKELVGKNVFSKIRLSNKPNEERNVYVSRELIDRIIDAGCPSAEWRVFVALMRYGGMRCPSEVLLLRWSDVDFTGEKGFWGGLKKPAIKFRSIKTEHHQGGAYRVIPMFKELRPYLEDLYESIPDDEGRKYVIWSMLPKSSRSDEGKRAKKNFSKAFRLILEKLNIEAWPKLFANLRRSCRNDLERSGLPIRVINEWLGHSEKVANAHYVQTLPADIDWAIGESPAGNVNDSDDSAEGLLQKTTSMGRDVQRISEGVSQTEWTNECAKECATLGKRGDISHNRKKQTLQNTVFGARSDTPYQGKCPQIGQVGLEPTTKGL